jgi:hypothetical protein
MATEMDRVSAEELPNVWSGVKRCGQQGTTPTSMHGKGVRLKPR